MAVTLTTENARVLRAAAPNRLRARALRWMVFALGAVASTVVLSVAPGPDCTPEDSCPNEPFNMLGIGVFFASWLVLGWRTPRLAALAAACAALGGLIWDQFHPADASLTAELTLVAYAVLTAVVAWLRRDRPPVVPYLGRGQVLVRIPPTIGEFVWSATGACVVLSAVAMSIVLWWTLDAWQLLAALVGAGGLVLMAIGVRLWSIRRRLNQPNPVAQAELIGGNLFAGDARPGDPPFARLTGALSGLPRTVLIYGVPVVGRTVVVATESEARPARVRPVKGPIPVAALRPEDIAMLPRDEVTASVETVHSERKPAIYGYALSMAPPLALVEMIRRMPATAALAVSVLLTVMSFAVGYAIWLRPAVAWSGGGISARGILTRLSRPWPQITGISTEADLVHIISAQESAVSVVGRRTAQSLASSLQYARSRATPTVAVPPMPSIRRPWLFPVLFPVPVAILMTMQHFS